MKKLKVMAALALAGSMVLSMTACGGSTAETTAAPAATEAAKEEEKTEEAGSEAAEAGDFDALDEVNLIIASSASSNLANYGIQEAAAQAASDKTGGKLTIELNWDGILGDDAALVENCIGGTIPMVSLSSSALFNYIPEIGVLDCPAVYGSPEAAFEGIGSMVDTLAPLFEEKGMVLLDMGFASYRALSTNVRIEKPEDFNGMSIRTLDNDYHMAFWSNLGCTPTPLAFSDLYLSLQQGLVDAQDNAAPAVYAQKFYEVQDYYMATPVFLNVSCIVMSKSVYESLDPAYQQVLRDFADEYTYNAYQNSATDEATSIENMGDNIEVLPVTDEILAAFQEAAVPVWNTIAENLGDELVDSYLATGGITR